MRDFIIQANELLEFADNFRKQIQNSVPKDEITSTNHIENFVFLRPGVVAPIVGSILAGVSAFITILPNVIDKLIKDINDSPQHNYTTKDISDKTGIEEWRLRRYIAKKRLKANSNKSSDGNPGRSGYSISKENLIEFIQANASEISTNKKINKSMEQFKSNIKQSINIFLEHVTPLIVLGELEEKLTQLENPNIETIEHLKIKILLQKLRMEKKFFEEQKNFLAEFEQSKDLEIK